MKHWIILILFSCAVSIAAAQTPIDTGIVTSVDVYPQFRGGVNGWNRFVQQNLNLRDVVNSIDSTTYVDYGLRQTAMLEFTVCEDGKVCDAVIVNKSKISPEFAEEALRIINKSPKWTPARKDGKGVRTRFRQSITAVLD
ncbi:TonB family protein [Sphingobacterium oryzagri]|uniref:TonB family protein n=1 Tax=Sphingobacterium oryzagri TaxID=3025669 RepID=A0ABY7WL99_9SPHI|nr:TonB family protein [Sphingobacterium sp. KACC 22765]WDF69417.1 TonB family protein [Sphingobacterium sp. KACC 22765]